MAGTSRVAADGRPIVDAAVAAPDVASEERAALHTASRPLLMLGVMAATFMQVLDSTIVNVALRDMTASLDATSDTITWVLTSYIVAGAVAIPLTGWLADRIGSRNLFLVSVVGFVAASMLCGLATGLPEMVAFRILQGIAAAFMSPLSQTVMIDINPTSKQAGAMSIWGMGIMVGPILGPVIGGWLTDNYDWRWCFYVNVPVGAVCFAILWAYLPARGITRRGFDLFGFATLAVAISVLQLMLDRGQTQDWFASWEVWLEGLVVLGATWMFAVQLATAPRALIDRAMLRNRNLMTGLGFMLVIGVLMNANLALLPSMLQGLYGYSVWQTGLLLMPRGVGVIFSMWVAGQAMKWQVDPRWLVGCGLVVTSVSLWNMTGWTLEMGAREFVVSGTIQGIGLGLVFVPLNLMAFGTLAPQYRTEASSLLNLARSIGGSVGISVVTAVLARNVQTSHQDLVGHVPDLGLVGNDPVTVSITGGSTDTLFAVFDGMVNAQAAMIAYLDDFKLMMILSLAAIPLVFLLRRPATPAPGEAVYVVME